MTVQISQINDKKRTVESIVFVIGTLGYGGAERVLVTLANHFASLGTKTTIITITEGDETPYSLGKGVQHIQQISLGLPVIRKVEQIKKLRIKIKEINPDVVVSFLSVINITTIAAMLNLKIPIIISERNNPLTDPSKNSLRIARKILYPLSDGFVFQTEMSKDYFEDRIKKRSVVIPNPLMTEKLPVLWNKERRKEIVTVGRMVEQKNQEILIKVFSKISVDFPEYRLVLYGEGELKGNLKKLTQRLGVQEKVEMPGNKENILDCINGAAVFVLTSNYEGMPNALMEALALGIPSISTDCPSGGPAYLIQNEKNGLLIPVQNEEALEKALRKLLTSPEMSNKFSKNSLEIKEQLDSKKILNKWIDYIERVASE